jgi:hypothetical protein
MIPAIEPMVHAQETASAIGRPTVRAALQVIAAGKGVAVELPDPIGQTGRVPETAAIAQVLVGRMARMALAAVVRVEALQIDRADRTLVKIIRVQGLIGRIPRDVLTGRALGGPALDLKD